MNRIYKKLGISPIPEMIELQKNNASFEDLNIEKIGLRIKSSLPGLEKTNFDYGSLSRLDQFLEKDKEKSTSLANLTSLAETYSSFYGLPIFDPRKNKNKEVIGHYRITSKTQKSNAIPSDARLEAFAGDEEEGQVFLAIYTNPKKYIELVISLNDRINFAFFETQNGLTELNPSYFIEGEKPELGIYRKNKFLYRSWAGNHDIVSIFTNEKFELATAIMGEVNYKPVEKTTNVSIGVFGCGTFECSGTVPAPSPPPSTSATSSWGITSALEAFLEKQNKSIE